MPHNLPIYDNLLLNIEKQDITINSKLKDTLINDITKYKNTHELVFAIIRYYQINNSSHITQLPFYCKWLKTKQGYKFDIDNLPDKLIKIMIEFYNLHKKSIDDKGK